MKKMIFLSLVLAFSTASNLFSQGNGTNRDQKEIATDKREIRMDQAQGDRADFEYKQFAGQTRRLREAILKSEPNKMAAMQANLVQSMRAQINQMDAKIAQAKNELVRSQTEVVSETKDVKDSRADGQPQEAAADRQDRRDDRHDARDDAKDLAQLQDQMTRMQAILADFQAFTFKIDNAAEGEIKVKMLDEFGQMMHKNMIATRRELHEDRRELREDKKERREDKGEKLEKN